MKTKPYDVMKSVTESSRGIDFEHLSFEEKLKSINQRDHEISEVMESVTPKFIEFFHDKGVKERLENGGKIFAIGAGTSGRLSVFVESRFKKSLFKGLIAGGDGALVQAQEGAEDDFDLSWEELKSAGFEEDKDILIGVAASGRTPYVLGALKKAQEENIPTGCIVCNSDAPAIEFSDFPFVAEVGPESVRGSTRMGAGTIQMLILNQLAKISAKNKKIRKKLEKENQRFKAVADEIQNHIPTLSLLGEKIIKVIRDEINQETMETEKKGGNLFYIGDENLGRIGFLDAVEIPPTFGQEYEKIQGIIAGGKDEIGNFKGLRQDISGGKNQGIEDLKKAGFDPQKDFLIGIGNSEYVKNAVNSAEEKSENVFEININSKNSSDDSEKNINLKVNKSEEEVALKMTLQMLSSAMMAETGFVAGDEMINIKTSNEKLKERAFQILKRQKFANMNHEIAFKLFEEIQGGRLFKAIGNYQKKVKKIYIAGDGGGTSLDLGLYLKFDSGVFGKVAKVKIKEPFSSSTNNEKNLKKTLKKGVQALQKTFDFDLKNVELVGFGVAGAEAENNQKKVNKILQEVFPEAKTIHTCSDIKASLTGSIGNSDEQGIQLIGGTGAVVARKKRDGTLRFFGGDGPLLGDLGSAFDIGNKITGKIFALLQDYSDTPEKITEEDFFHEVLEKIAEFLKTEDENLDLSKVIIPALYQSPDITNTRKIFSQITPIVLKEINKKSPNIQAQETVNDAILALVDLVIRANNSREKIRENKQVPVFLHGGLFNSEYIRDRIENLVGRQKGLQIKEPKFSALEGALLEAEASQELKEKILKNREKLGVKKVKV